MEDDRLVGSLVETILEKRGFRVLLAASPNEALEVAREHATEIDLLLTHVALPGMSGRELADRIRARCPQARVLFISGWRPREVARLGVLANGRCFLQKPFHPAELARKVERILCPGV